MSHTAIPFIERNQATTPGGDFVFLFYDTDNANVLTAKYHDCTFDVIGDLNPTAGIDTSKLDDCLCAIVEKASDDFSCAVAKGVITMADYNSYIQNIKMYSTITIDPATGSTTHGLTTEAVLFVQLTDTDVLCNGDSTGVATATVSGGAAPYTLTWEDLTPAPVNPAALAAGAYTLTVVDSNGITQVRSFVIQEPPALAIAAVTTPDTGGGNGTAYAAVTGGVSPYTYDWRDNVGIPLGQTASLATGLVAGTYQIHIVDANGCIDSDLAVIVA
ncbi:MAG: hypothetical protein COA88_12810 [Kordia sp.]|nr:MAG: hypothetical protein COA88_12810 [Kordia sp.]